MPITIPPDGRLKAFAMIVDINGFTRMVESAQDGTVAQYVHDVLSGGIRAVESQGGQVVGFMGDAFLALVSSPEEVFFVCVTIARDVDRQCEWISDAQRRSPGVWHYAPGGPSLKIAVEHGEITATRIGSAALGTQPLLIGSPINYASRICSGGVGNRCVFGPSAAAAGLSKWSHEGPFTTPGKPGEPDYTYFQLELGDVWREGKRNANEESYWG